VLALWLVGCSGPEVLADYRIELHPRTLDATAPFAGAPLVSIVVRDRLAGTTIHPLGAWTGAALTVPSLGPLDSAYVGVLVQTSDADPSAYDATKTLAYGEAGPFDASTGGTVIDAPFALPMVGRSGLIDELPVRTLNGAMASTADGRTYVFGGAEALTVTAKGGSSNLFVLDDVDSGDWTWREAGETPDFDEDGTPDEIVGATADAFQLEGEQYIALIGGRDNNNSFGDNRQHIGIYKPASSEWVWADEGLRLPRSEHVTVRMSATGNFVVIGGILEDGYIPGCGFTSSDCASFEIVDAEDWTAKLYNEDDFVIPSLGFATVDLGTTGVLVCGGGDFSIEGAEQLTTPQDDCLVIRPDGTLEPRAPLPMPMQGGVMSALSDGRVLFTGGIEAICPFFETCLSTDRALLYDPEADQWRETAGKLNRPHTQHAQRTLPDGRVLILGGAEGGGPVAADISDPVVCNEMFDPTTETFSVLTPCDAPPLGADGMVAGDAERGFLLVEGIDHEGRGGDWFGLVGAPPVLTALE
jgi:hypothetical protein